MTYDKRRGWPLVRPLLWSLQVIRPKVITGEPQERGGGAQMAQTVDDIMTRTPVSLSGQNSVRDAARHMRESHVGAIVVVQGRGELFGIVTDRDIVIRCIAQGLDPDKTPLHEICTPELATLSPDDEVDHAVALMRDRAVRRIPVVKNGKAVGILSLGDLALERDPQSALGRISSASPNT
jgi:CBS domain-containing protein